MDLATVAIISSITIPTLAFVATQIWATRATREKADSNWVSSVEKELALVKGNLAECVEARTVAQTEIRRLSSENFDMMRRLLKLENGN